MIKGGGGTRLHIHNGHADHLWKYERAFCLEEGLIGDCGWRVKGHRLQRNTLTRLFEAADAE